MASDKPTNNPGNQPDVPQADGAPESRGNIFDLLAEEEAVSERDQHIATFKQDVANDVTAANKLRQVFDLIAERKDEPEAQAFLNEVFKGIDMVEYIKSVGLAVTMVDMWEQIGKDQEFDEFLQNLFRTCFANEQLRALMRKPEPAPAPSRVQKSFEPAPASTPDSGPLHVSPELRQPSRMSAPRPAPVPAAPDPISASQAEPVQPAPRPAAKAAPAPAPAATPLGGGEVLESFDNEERQALLDRQTTEFLGQEDVPDTPANNLKQLFKFVLQMKHTPEAQAFFDGLNVDHGNALINAIEQNGLASVIVDMWDTVRRSNNIGFDEYLKELYTKLYSGEHFQALVALVNKRTESLSPQEELAPDPSIEIGPIVYDEGVDEEVEVLGVDDPNLVGFRDVPSFDVPSIDSDDDEDAIPLDSAGSAEIIEAKDVGRISEVLGSVLESESPLNGTSKENPADEAARAASIPPVQPEPKFGRGGSYTIAMRNHEVEEDSREHIRVVVAGTKMNVGPHAVVHVDLVDEGSEITLGSNSRIHIEKTTNGCKGNPVVIKKAPDAVI
ncbi:hypothetical protein KJ742_06625, partial [Patescibacteria group bacterium]|nr:hypothetical protein [Patescibacteria group bacterium]